MSCENFVCDPFLLTVVDQMALGPVRCPEKGQILNFGGPLILEYPLSFIPVCSKQAKSKNVMGSEDCVWRRVFDIQRIADHL